ncbi:unnamed protein product [Clonostachys rosea]|uniref:Uncharacterized protein n=1 Tax=Bionectria ochroleuca TaxID=29856 RepID=A0ABY6U0F3_BIOOC|nr:unnamed protein product [Clonostachys rosea]
MDQILEKIGIMENSITFMQDMIEKKFSKVDMTLENIQQTLGGVTSTLNSVENKVDTVETNVVTLENSIRGYGAPELIRILQALGANTNECDTSALRQMLHWLIA